MDLTVSLWFLPVLGSALGLGFYDLCKKHAVRENSVMPVLFFATLCGSAVFAAMTFLFGDWHSCVSWDSPSSTSMGSMTASSY